MNKERFKEMKTKLAPYATFAGGVMTIAGIFGGAYLLGGKVTELKIAVGTMKLHEAGLIKYFNEEGAEVGIEEACKVVKRFSDKK